MSQSTSSPSTPSKSNPPRTESLQPIANEPPYQTARGCLMLTIMLLVSLGLMVIAMWLFVDHSA